MRRKLHDAARHGFTLLELLIVIGLVAVLAVLSISGVQLVRSKALSIRCVENLRQVSSAFLVYAADHQNKINLYAEKPGAGTSVQWLRYLTGRVDRDHNRSTGGPVYLHALDTAICPAFKPMRWNSSNNYGYSYGASLGGVGSDPYSVAPEGTKSISREISLAKLDQPSRYWLLSDSYDAASNSQFFGIYPDLRKTSGAHFRHQGRANTLFADGHVESLTLSAFSELPYHPVSAGFDGEQKPIF